jgi:hypothetical protein
VVGALLAAESGLHESYFDTIASAAIAVAVYWLAHAYADVLGRRLSVHERLTSRALGRALVVEAAIVRGASLPLLVLALCWALGVSQRDGVTVALWSTVAALIAFELIAGIRSRATRGELALDVGVGTAMGVAIIALKVILQ